MSEKHIRTEMELTLELQDMIMITHADLHLLRMAIEIDDPRAEILIRVEDIHTRISKLVGEN